MTGRSQLDHRLPIRPSTLQNTVRNLSSTASFLPTRALLSAKDLGWTLASALLSSRKAKARSRND